MLDSNKCKNCGANVVKKAGGYYCEYCGSSYTARDNAHSESTVNVSMERPTMTDEVLKTVAFSKNSKAAAIPVAAFGVLWVIVTFGMGIAVLTSMDHGPKFIGCVPFFMGIFGIVIFSISIKSILGPKALRHAANLADRGNWNAAYQTLQESYSDKTNAEVCIALVLIAFYKFKDDEKAKHYIIDLKQLSVVANAKVKLIADYLGVDYNAVNYSFHDESQVVKTSTYHNESGSITINGVNIKYSRSSRPHQNGFDTNWFGPKPPRF